MDKDSPILRQKTESLLREELDWLREHDQDDKPENWELSPRSVLTFVLGGEVAGKTIKPKYIGQQSLIETAIATLITDRALLLTGVPGTAKSWVGDHLAAAISGDTSYLIQGSSSTTEEDLLFGWNYASLIAHGPSETALVPGAIFRGMTDGKIVRIEELTRIPAIIQDNLISILSEKMMTVPELRLEVRARQGFNIIATANDKDRGTYALSDALKRRFNVVHLPLPGSMEEEIRIIRFKLEEESINRSIEAVLPEKEIQRIVQIFRELRSGITTDGKQKIKPTENALSTAEAISTAQQSINLARFFGNGVVSAREVAQALPGSIIKNPDKDGPAWEDYRRTIIAQRKEWMDLNRELTPDSENA